MDSYLTILERMMVVRNAPWRSDPDREQAMREITTQILIDVLQKLHDQFEKSE